MLAHLKIQQLIGSMGSQKILWDLKDLKKILWDLKYLKKYFGISKISKNTLGSQNICRSQKFSSDLEKILNIWALRKYSTIVEISEISKILPDLKYLKNTHPDRIWQILMNLPFAKRQMNSGDHGGKLDQKASKLWQRKIILCDTSLIGKWWLRGWSWDN